MEKGSFCSLFYFLIGMSIFFTVHDTNCTVIVAKIYDL